mmetsp:Transcript_32128/g.93871  ORF Transcript_32128/g.93871 Transcript_32128/m.93871 type:complete len:216 (+) Transcript_32128:523-1170(+)
MCAMPENGNRWCSHMELNGTSRTATRSWASCTSKMPWPTAVKGSSTVKPTVISWNALAARYGVLSNAGRDDSSGPKVDKSNRKAASATSIRDLPLLANAVEGGGAGEGFCLMTKPPPRPGTVASAGSSKSKSSRLKQGRGSGRARRRELRSAEAFSAADAAVRESALRYTAPWPGRSDTETSNHRMPRRSRRGPSPRRSDKTSHHRCSDNSSAVV